MRIGRANVALIVDARPQRAPEARVNEQTIFAEALEWGDPNPFVRSQAAGFAFRATRLRILRAMLTAPLRGRLTRERLAR